MRSIGVVDSILAIGPSSSYNAWYDEYNTCFGHYPEFENLADQNAGDCSVYLTASSKNHKEITFINIDKIRRLTSELSVFLSSHKVLLIIDEAHKIKNPEAKSTISAMEFSKFATARIILTGTPMPNGYEDLYSLAKTFSPFHDILPYNYQQLRNMTKGEASEAQANQIRRAVSPYYSRISKKYLLATKELLAPNFHVIPCQMSDEQAALYDRLNDFCGKLTDSIDEDVLEGLKKAILIRKMQISANPALLRGSLINSMDELREDYGSYADKDGSEIGCLVKADKELMAVFGQSSIFRTVRKFETRDLVAPKNLQAVQLAAELVAKGEKVLIWDIFVKNMEILKSMLETAIPAPVEIINGAVSGFDRQMALKRFREGNSMVLLANPATLAESISLHKVCQNAIYVNRNFNAAQFIQSKDRIHRINMPVGKTATYYFLLNSSSVDEKVDEKLRKKEERMLAILDADDIEVGGSEMEDSSIMSAQDIEDCYMG